MYIMDLRVLWTTATAMGTVSDIRMLKSCRGFNIEVVTADTADKDSAGALVAKKNFLIPDGDDPDYIDSIRAICRGERITTVIPQTGSELCPLSKNKESFEQSGVKVLVSADPGKLNIAGDKGMLYDFFRDEEYIPEYRIARSIPEIEEAAKYLGYPNVPVCVKPLRGEGGKGFCIIAEHNIDFFKQGSGGPRMSLKILEEYLNSAGDFPPLLVSEYLPGAEYSVDCVCMEGATIVCVPRVRIETMAGVATVSKFEKNEGLIRIAEGIISKLNLSYNVNLQFRYAADGKPRLMEINPRVSGSLVANCGAGVNMMELSLRLAYGLPLGALDVKWGTTMLRYWDQFFI